jgi:subtilisin family serine protease
VSVRAVHPLDDITREWAWHGATGAGVKVAIIDTGVDATHPAIGQVDGYVSISETTAGVEFDSTPHDDVYGHGTACAGIIRSLAPECEIYSIRVLDAKLGARGTVFDAALRWAIDHGMHVCNLSLGTTRREAYAGLHELADEAYFRNIALVTAANNQPVPSFPSTYASVISVAAHAEPDPELLYYNPRPPVEFGAFGLGVRVAWTYGSTITAGGNSFAAPHVTGLVARILGKHPDLTAFQLKAVLRALCANVVRGV